MAQLQKKIQETMPQRLQSPAFKVQETDTFIIKLKNKSISIILLQFHIDLNLSNLHMQKMVEEIGLLKIRIISKINRY